MKSQHIDDGIMRVQDRQSALTEVGAGGISPTTEAVAQDILPLLLVRLTIYFDGRVDSNDAETLVFCLCQLFYRVTLLYQNTLPALADANGTTMGKGVSPHFLSRHHTWTHLRQIIRALERVESLSHLLNDVTENILEALDATCSPGSSLGERAFIAIEQQMLSTESVQWEQAYTALAEQLNRWQQYGVQRLSFAIQFAHLTPTLPTLTDIDNALDLLLDNASAIFGDIFPDLQAISPSDDEAVATLLFDLMQQSDLLLVHIESLLEPLHLLLRQYTVLEQ